MNGTFDWTEERVEFLKARHALGLSANQIAVDIRSHYDVTLTRNAVIGKLSREGLSSRTRLTNPPRSRRDIPTAPRKPKEGHQMPCRSSAVSLPPTPEIAWATIYGPFRPCSIMDLNDKTCRWIVSDDGEPAAFCGAPYASLSDNMPYCSAHSRLAYQPGRERRVIAWTGPGARP